MGPSGRGVKSASHLPRSTLVEPACSAQNLSIKAVFPPPASAVTSAIRRGVRDAELRLDAARERVGLMGTAVIPHAEHAFDAASVAYAGNRGEFADVIESQRALLAARVEYAAARAELELGLAQLERAMGDGRDDRWPDGADAPRREP